MKFSGVCSDVHRSIRARRRRYHWHRRFGSGGGAATHADIAAAGIIGFLGNEVVARYRTVVGRRIGSAALVADAVTAVWLASTGAVV